MELVGHGEVGQPPGNLEDVPASAVTLLVGWDAIPEGLVSRHLGSTRVRAAATALLAVPSVIIDEEDNVLINPTHPDAARLTAAKVRRFVYDHRVSFVSEMSIRFMDGSVDHSFFGSGSLGSVRAEEKQSSA